MTLAEQLADVPRPPWPAEHLCTAPGCGHRRDQHREPLVEEGQCLRGRILGLLGGGCPCYGWDPLTTEQWKTVYAAQREGLVG